MMWWRAASVGVAGTEFDDRIVVNNRLMDTHHAKGREHLWWITCRYRSVVLGVHTQLTGCVRRVRGILMRMPQQQTLGGQQYNSQQQGAGQAVVLS